MEEVLAAYEDAEAFLLKRMASLLAKGNPAEKGWAEAKLAQLRLLKATAAKLIATLATHDAAVAALVGQGSIAFLSSTRFQLLRSTLDIYRSVIASATQRAILGVTTRRGAALDALIQFAAKGITGFVTKDGRQYELLSYIEMATRTATMQAAREATLQRIGAGGLIIVSSVPNPSPQCKPYERKVLSVDGSNPNYPSLDDAKAHGLFHPQCRHTFTKYVPGLTPVVRQEPQQYERTQEQRALERKVRSAKRILAVDPQNPTAKARLATATTALRTFPDRKPRRESIVAVR